MPVHRLRNVTLPLKALELLIALSLLVKSPTPSACLTKSSLKSLSSYSGLGEALGSILYGSLAGLPNSYSNGQFAPASPYAPAASPYPYVRNTPSPYNGYGTYTQGGNQHFLESPYTPPIQQIGGVAATNALANSVLRSTANLEGYQQDPYSQFIDQYGMAPSAPQTLEKKPKEAMKSLEGGAGNKTCVHKKVAANAEDSFVAPEMILELKRSIVSQQNDASQLQKQVNELLKELKDERERVSDEKSRVASQGNKKAFHMDIEFPAEEEPENIRVEKLPATNTSAEQSTQGADGSANKEARVEVKEPIPLMVVKPDGVQDISSLLKQSVEQTEAELATEETESESLLGNQMLTPEERLKEAVATTDELEAKKGEIEAEMRIAEKRISEPNLNIMAQPFAALSPLVSPRGGNRMAMPGSFLGPTPGPYKTA